jgi:hypothetical protein
MGRLRGLLAVLGLVAGLSLAAVAAYPPAPAGAVLPSTVTVALDNIASNFVQPVLVTSIGDRSYRLFVVEQGGTVRVVHGYDVQSAPYLDISAKVVSGGEQGLLSIAFHPGFASHRYLYAAYTRSSDGALVVSRFTASSPTATSVSSATELVLLVVPHPTETNHNGGQLAFGRDGYLYISTGDGGGGGDPFGNAENLRSLSGKLLRIDVNRVCSGLRYCVPSTNPFVTSSTTRHEILDYGLRNPWRFSFDRTNGTLWIGDVGQNNWEEIDHASTAGGLDFGWSCREGLAIYNSARCTIGSRTRHITAPVAVYGHSDGSCAVIGGFDYDGPKYAFARGLYVYTDYCTGTFHATGRTASGTFSSTIVGHGPVHPTGFGESDSGEIFVVNQNGHLYHVRFVQR